jgi:hypothetical protein
VITEVAVVVPAADEENDIAACLTALDVAQRNLHEATGGAVTSRVIIALDDCHDGTAAIVTAFLDVETVATSARCVGAARRLGTNQALAGRDPSGRLWLAHTDADCLVPPDWLTQMVSDADRGYNLVVGTVRPAPGLPEAVEQAWLAAHDLTEGHPHVHGANLGIDAASYVELGGWRDLLSHEDTDLVERAQAHGRLRIRRSGVSTVVAGSRLTGRAPDGFARYLSDLVATLPEAG